MNLPEDFIRETRLVMGENRFNRFLGAFYEEAPTSIRLNPRLLRSEECGVWSENTPAADQTTPCPSYSGGENTLQGNHNSPLGSPLATEGTQEFATARKIWVTNIEAASWT